MSNKIFNSEKRDEWYTPLNIIKKFGPFDYDPATTSDLANQFNIKNFDTIKTNGLKHDWCKYKKIWLNPPFSNKKEFLIKAQSTFNQVHNDIYILLPIHFLTTKTFHNIINAFILYIPNNRIKFSYPDLNKPSAPYFGSVIIKLSEKNQLELFNYE